MNASQNITATAIATQQIYTGPAVLTYADFLNNGGSPVFYALLDAASVPTAGAGAPGFNASQALTSGVIAAGAHWKPFPVTSPQGFAVLNGLVLVSFPAVGSAGVQNPNLLAYASANTNIVAAWVAPLS